MSMPKRKSPGGLEVVGGLLAVLALSALLRFIGGMVIENNLHQTYPVRPQIQRPGGF